MSEWRTAKRWSGQTGVYLERKIFAKNRRMVLPALIAEVGLAHDGSLWLAHAYIDAVADAGATHVKLQAHSHKESSVEETWRQRPITDASL